MNNHSNENLIKVIVLARELLLLADEGDADREDVGCGILYGTLRDCAYKIRALAETEIITHKRNNTWQEDAATLGQHLWLSPDFPLEEFAVGAIDVGVYFRTFKKMLI